jgi:hypothetical protein
MYAVVVVDYDLDEPVEQFSVTAVDYRYLDIKDAEKARVAYLDLFPEINPQNIQVISWSP